MANIRMTYMAPHSTRARRSTPVKMAASGIRWKIRNGAECFQSTRHGSTADARGSNAGASYLLVGRHTVAPVGGRPVAHGAGHPDAPAGSRCHFALIRREMAPRTLMG